MPRDGTESAQMLGAMARAGSERPFEPLRRRRWADSVPRAPAFNRRDPRRVGRKRPACFVVGPQRIYFRYFSALRLAFGPFPAHRGA